jgi:hypothetical protein
VAEPWNAHTLTDAQPLDTRSERIDSPNNLVTGNDRNMWIGKLSVDNV